ncbi:MAG: YceI family protein [Burkholderiales bacterium]|nr:YceI family protein [Burkholderiales bacterium]
MNARPWTLLVAAMAVAASTGVARAAEWRSDPAASRLAIAATFEGASVPGAFRAFDVRLRLDPANPAAGSLEATIQVASADFGIADVNREIVKREWFDALAHPQAVFRSRDLARLDADRFRARGTLTLKGVARPVEFPFTFVVRPDGAALEGALVLQRGAFGIGQGEWAATNVIGADVKVNFAVKLVPMP